MLAWNGKSFTPSGEVLVAGPFSLPDHHLHDPRTTTSDMDPQKSTKGDAALVLEMIKLLSDELQCVQTEIEDLQNDRSLPAVGRVSCGSIKDKRQIGSDFSCRLV